MLCAFCLNVIAFEILSVNLKIHFRSKTNNITELFFCLSPGPEQQGA